MPGNAGTSLQGNIPIVRASGLKKYFVRKKKCLKAVDGVDLEIYPGQTLGLVGESGCGKSTLGRLLLKLAGSTEGRIFFDGIPIENYSDREMRPIRYRMQIVFQDPYNSLNPRKTIVESVMDPLRLIKSVSTAEREQRAVSMLREAGLDESQFRKYPHELSGGQRQRAVIARAMAVNPEFIVCDEPVSSLDVSIRAQILTLIKKLRDNHRMSCLFISHDLSVIRYLCDTVAVMYLGKIIEIGSRSEIFNNPVHPYTQALMSAIPIPDVDIKRNRLILKGDIPSPVNIPRGCRFRQRCPWPADGCGLEDPVLRPCGNAPGETHKAACTRIPQGAAKLP
jgi:peptide/nickel transport system ATP-binding protein/oligopeptide transport system ATP-binding protein